MTWICRDAGIADYPAIREIAERSFPADTLLPPAVFLPLLSRTPPLVRIIERAGGDAGRFACGYYAFWPTSRSTFESLAAGQLRESGLCERHLLDLAGSQTEVLYVMDICVRSGLGPRPGLRLALDLRARLGHNLATSPHLASVAAWAYTSFGARLCAGAGMRPYRESAGEPGIWSARRHDVLAALNPQ